MTAVAVCSFFIIFLNISILFSFSDVNFLANSAPPAATEWQTLLRPLRGREPEGIWNLLSIVREMFRRKDANASTLLEIITDELLLSEQVMVAIDIDQFVC